MENFQGSFRLNPIVEKLTRDGIITVNVVFTKFGVDVWARAAQAHPRLGIYPNESLMIEDLAERFSKHQSLNEEMAKELPSKSTTAFQQAEMKRGSIVNTSHFGSSSLSIRAGKTASDLASSKNSQSAELASLASMSVSDAKRNIARMHLGYTNNSGLLNLRPQESLIREDLDAGPIGLFSRMVAVAAKLGNDKISGRIRTQSDLSVARVTNLHEWWASATPTQRLRVLSSNKKLDISSLRGDLPERVLVGLPHPFRGVAEEMVESSDEEESGLKLFSDDEE